MKADIFIPTSNRIDSLTQCLKSLNKQTIRDFRVILVGLKEDKNIKKLVESFSDMDILYFIQKEGGLINAANEAIGKTKNEIFIRIDDDVILDEKWLRNILNTFENDRAVGGVTGPTTMSEEGIKSRDLTSFLNKFEKSKNPILKFIFFVYNDFLYEGKMYEVSQFLESGVFTLGSNFPDALKISELKEVNNLEACNWSCRIKLLKKIGGFDIIYVRGLGDYHEADAALKIRALGYKLIFNSKARLRHNVEIGKVAKARPAPYYRIQNFIIFYFRFFKIKRVNQFFKFLTNLVLQNGYYLFRFFTTLKLNQLGSIPGTFVGFIKVFFLSKNKQL